MNYSKEERFLAWMRRGIFQHPKDDKTLNALRRMSIQAHRSRLPVHVSMMSSSYL